MTTWRSLFAGSILIAGVLPFGLGGCTNPEDLIGTIGFLGGQLCETDARCNDGLFCNGEEYCGNDGFCVDGVVPCGESDCDEEANVCTTQCSTEFCDDGQFCNGRETCGFSDANPGGFCINGPLPCFTDEVCLEDEDRCVECTSRKDCSEGELCIDELCIEAPMEPEDLTVHFRNEDIDTTHLLTDGEDFGPQNRLAPNGSRTVVLPSALTGDVFTFRAGRNGVVFATVDCQFFPEPLEDAVVTWTGFELTCSGDLTLR